MTILKIDKKTGSSPILENGETIYVTIKETINNQYEYFSLNFLVIIYSQLIFNVIRCIP